MKVCECTWYFALLQFDVWVLCERRGWHFVVVKVALLLSRGSVSVTTDSY